MSLTVSAGWLARGWHAVAAASVASKDRPAFDRTIYIEQHTHGLRITATDSYILLTAWVPERNYEIEPEASPDEVPIVTAVAQDPYGRGAGLLSHLARLEKADKDKALDLDVIVQLNVPWQAEDTPTADLQLDGFEALAVSLEHPGTERVQLGVYEGPWPHYREFIVGHITQRARNIALSQRNLAALAKAAKPFGPIAQIGQRFGGEEKPVLVTFGEEPAITGIVMPMRWDFEHNQPWGVDDTDSEDERDET